MGKLAEAYRARARRVPPETARARGDVGKILLQGLSEATEQQLYDRTPLPVTHKMGDSVQVRYLGSKEVAVGYDRRIAPHAPFRLAKEGTSLLGGHDMTMRPGEQIERDKAAAIRERFERAQKNIAGPGVKS